MPNIRPDRPTFISAQQRNDFLKGRSPHPLKVARKIASTKPELRAEKRDRDNLGR